MKHDLHDFSFSQKNHDFYLNFFKYIKTQNFNVDDVTERPRGTCIKHYAIRYRKEIFQARFQLYTKQF